MGIVPGITADGFRTAVRDYTEPTVVEELGANSYDADASILLVLLDTDKGILHIIDNGNGFDEDSFLSIATLGAGSKKDIPYSKIGQRHYLGSYGYGLKSTLNIATKVEIESYSVTENLKVTIDWNLLDEALKPGFTGFPSDSTKVNAPNSHGTYIKLFLKNPTTKAHLDKFGEVLANLPNDSGGFRCYYGLYGNVANQLNKIPDLFNGLHEIAKSLQEKNLVEPADFTVLADLHECQIIDIPDKKDKSVKAKIYFAGLQGDKVKQIKPGLRGIYVRIHGRLLKQSFTDSKFTYSISKWKKFESGVRVELSVDWLRDQISLSRTGIRFSNEKLEEEFKAVLTGCITGFIQPQLKKLANLDKLNADKKTSQRNELVNKRSTGKKDITIPCLNTGFIFRPETDGELALVIAQPDIQTKILKNHKLLDYNDQAPFDCIFYDEERKEFINTELEPNLLTFLAHKEKRDVQLIITWTLGQWRTGAKKKSNTGQLQLITDPLGRKGHYRLLEFASSTSKKPRKDYPVIVVEEVLK